MIDPDKLYAFKKSLNERLDRKLREPKDCRPEPRYDDVYFEGLNHFYELDGVGKGATKLKLKRGKIIKSSLSNRAYKVRKDCDFETTIAHAKTNGEFWIHWAISNKVIEEVKPDYLFVGERLVDYEE